MRRWPWVLLISTVVLIAVSACASSEDRGQAITADSIKARSFELTDDSGEARARLEVVEGEPRFMLLDQTGSSRLQIRLDETGNPSVNLFDGAGARRAGFEFANGVNPAMFLRDEDGRLKAGMQVQTGGAPLLFLRNSVLEDGFAVTLIEEDLPVMAMADQNGNNRTFLGLDGQGSGSLVFVGADGVVESVIP